MTVCGTATQALKVEMYLSYSQSGGGELREQTAEDGGMEIHQQTSLSAK